MRTTLRELIEFQLIEKLSPPEIVGVLCLHEIS